MKVTIFIVKVYSNGISPDNTVKSFKDKGYEFKFVDSLFEVNEIDKEGDWFGVFYENEVISETLLESLNEFFTLTKADVLVAFKKDKDKKYSKCPRFFRQHVELSIESLSPEDRTIQHEIMLNGWVKEQ